MIIYIEYIAIMIIALLPSPYDFISVKIKFIVHQNLNFQHDSVIFQVLQDVSIFIEWQLFEEEDSYIKNGATLDWSIERMDTLHLLSTLAKQFICSSEELFLCISGTVEIIF